MLTVVSPGKPWDWFKLSENPSITSDIVNANTDKPWVWWELSSNQIITSEIVNSNLDKNWNWFELSSQSQMLVSSMDLCNIIKRHRAAKTIQKHWKS